MTALSPETVKVGYGITEHIGSDRRACTITYVSPSGKTIGYTHDDAVNKGDYYGQQDWEFTPTPEFERVDDYGQKVTNRRTAKWSANRGMFASSHIRVSTGKRHYMDPSF